MTTALNIKQHEVLSTFSSCGDDGCLCHFPKHDGALLLTLSESACLSKHS